MLASSAYLADTTAVKYLALRLSILDVTVNLSGGFTNMAVGYWIKDSGYVWPSVFVCIVKCLALLYAVFFIPETITRSPTTGGFKCEELSRTWKLYTSDNGTGRVWALRIVTLSYILAHLYRIKGSMVRLLEMNAPLCWGPVLMGIYDAVSLNIQGLGSLLGAVILHKYWLISDQWIMVIGRASTAAEMFFIPFVQNTVMMFFGKYFNLITYVIL